MDQTIKIEVRCYSGYRACERPESFVLGEKVLTVEEIPDRWYGPDYRYFKVLASDGNVYILRYSENEDRWELELFRKT